MQDEQNECPEKTNQKVHPSQTQWGLMMCTLWKQTKETFKRSHHFQIRDGKKKRAQRCLSAIKTRTAITVTSLRTMHREDHQQRVKTISPPHPSNNEMIPGWQEQKLIPILPLFKGQVHNRSGGSLHKFKLRSAEEENSNKIWKWPGDLLQMDMREWLIESLLGPEQFNFMTKATMKRNSEVKLALDTPNYLK